VRQQIVLFDELNDGFVAGLIGLVPAHLPQSHFLEFLQRLLAWSAVSVAVLPVGAINF